MVGILEFCLARELTHLTMLAEHRLAERIAAYDWPLRFPGAPPAYEDGKGGAVAAEIEVGLHVLALTRMKAGVRRTIRLKIDLARIMSSGPASPAIVAPNDPRPG